jgi:glutamate dehydrogenase
MEQLPRDELFATPVEALFQLAIGVLSLENRPRVQLFTRADIFARFVICLVYLPRKHFNTDTRYTIQAILEQSYQGKVEVFYSQATDSPLARIHFKISTHASAIAAVDVALLSQQIAKAVSAWEDQLQEALQQSQGSATAQTTLRRYQHAFEASYRSTYSVTDAVRDIEKIEAALTASALTLDATQGKNAHEWQLKIYSPTQPLALSDILPVLEQLERFLREQGAGRIRPEIPLREALLAIVCSVLMRTSSGPLRMPLWGPTDDTRALALALFLPAAPPVEGLERRS